MDLSRSMLSPITFQQRSQSLQDALEETGGEDRGPRSRPPLRNKSTPAHVESGRFRTNRRNSSRNLRGISARLLLPDPLQNSDSSLNILGLSFEEAPALKPCSTGTLDTSRGSMDSSGSSIRILEHSPRRLSASEKSPARMLSSRVLERRRQSSLAASIEKGNNTANSSIFPSLGANESYGGNDEDTVATFATKQSVTNPHIVLARSSPQRRRREKSKQLLSSNVGQQGVIATTWTRNSMSKNSAKKGIGSSSGVMREYLDSQKERSLRANKEIGGSMRNILRNKRKLEKELTKSDIFRFVLHKVPPSDTSSPSTASPKEARISSTRTKNKAAAAAEKVRRRMSLDRFLLMKQKSECLVLESDIDSRLEEESVTWRMHSSVDFSKSAATCQLDSLGGDTQELLELAHLREEDETLNDEEGSLDMKDGTINKYLIESRTLSLKLDDIQIDDDTAHSERSLDRVQDYGIVDPSGRKAIYSGMVSRSSGMPCGRGRLEYPDEGKTFDGHFVHGYWTGYGRCMYSRTGEDYTGTFLDSIRHGHGTTKFQDGKIFEGTYVNGVNTDGKMIYQDGSTYLGRWINGVRHGRGTYTFPNGSVFFGEFADDCIHGSGVLTWSNGTRYVGKWKDGLRDGHGAEYRPNASIRREGCWKEGAFVEE